MSAAGLYEPDKNLSGVQAFLLLTVVTLPLLWSVSFRKTIIPEPIVVAIVSAPAPPVQETQPAPDLDKVREQIEATKHNLERAEIARRRAEDLAEQQRLDEERRLEAQRERREEEEARRQDELEERQRLEEEKQLEAETESKRLEDEEKRRQAEAKKQLQEEEERQRETEARKRAEEEAEARRQAEVDARLKSARDAKLMDRYMAGIHDRIKRHLTNPEGVSSGIEVEIRVRLNQNGRLADEPEVTKVSGHEQFDEQAVRAIIRGAQVGFDMPEDKDLREQFGELILVITPELGN